MHCCSEIFIIYYIRPGREWKGRRGDAMAARSRLPLFFSFPSFFTPCGCFFFPPPLDSLADGEGEDAKEWFLGSTLTSEGPQQNPMSALLSFYTTKISLSLFLSFLCSPSLEKTQVFSATDRVSVCA